MIRLLSRLVAAAALGGLRFMLNVMARLNPAVRRWIILSAERPARMRRLDATALNGRQFSGVRCHGDLGPQAEVVLAG